MAITREESQNIVKSIDPIFNEVLNEYEFTKYPIRVYDHIKQQFSNLTPTAQDIYDAIVWKYGHWGKQNFPQAHQNMIQQVQQLWSLFIQTNNSCSPSCTFQWWRNQLPESTRYITVAYITHLIHHTLPLPIIDQHNFRAMNYLLSQVRINYRYKKKPSIWMDVVHLKEFMETLLLHLDNAGFSELDRFLMMYGKKHVPR